jgi:uncharacterized protein (TIGR02996 family)
MGEPSSVLAAIRSDPNDGAAWLVLSEWYAEQGRYDEADAVRVFWPMMRESLETATLDAVLGELASAAKLLGGIARHVEVGRDDANEWTG